MKKIFITTFLLFSICFSVFAQRRFPDISPKDLPVELVDKLNINEDVEKKLNKAYVRLQEDVINTMIIAKKEGDINQEDLKVELNGYRQKHLKKVKDFMPDTAYTTYEEFIMLDRRERREYILVLKLKLTPDQKEKYDAIQASNEQVISKIKEQYKGDREAMRDALIPLKKQQFQMLAQVLTEEQMEILKASVPKRGNRQPID
ncbi:MULTISPECIES: hypothetical protein [Flammeovirga]|uniref:Uncharacterized protein n=1 Tax=Flammeovirga agarivorans TaxID=2726742 RepID=A0A7X8SMI3_9BACT|nr:MULTISPECIES: hypothetical protein [Flammeovirga]NLR92891.1 hypothetical protein [Flammeovirga agarivorans]